jgi:peroxiredoxin Q/BCP
LIASNASQEVSIMKDLMPAEGSRAPSFSVAAHDGTTVTLEEFVGKKHVVLFFFPKADTPG